MNHPICLVMVQNGNTIPLVPSCPKVMTGWNVSDVDTVHYTDGIQPYENISKVLSIFRACVTSRIKQATTTIRPIDSVYVFSVLLLLFHRLLQTLLAFTRLCCVANFSFFYVLKCYLLFILTASSFIR